MECFADWLSASVDVRTMVLLRSIDSERRRLAAQGNAKRPTWLIPFRHELRWAIQLGSLPTVKRYARDGPAEMLPLALWLWGHCADRFRLYGLQHYSRDPSPQTRKQVAKALRRVEAWTLLTDMARVYPDDEKLQWFASASISRRPFRERLSSYVQSVDDSHAAAVATPSRMPFWALEESSWDYTPPKSVQLIRRMLRRIRHWVRWGAS
jgi:hypothetical protein